MAVRSTGGRASSRTKRAFLYAILVLIAIVFLIPAYGSFVTSLKTFGELLRGSYWNLPKSLQWANYGEIWTRGHMGIYFLNSTIITIPAVILTIVFSSFLAYALVYCGFRLSKYLFILVVVGMFFPHHVYVLPIYLIFSRTGLINTYRALIAIHIVTQLSFGTLVLTNFFKTVPSEILESAKIDGCGVFGIYRRILMPLCVPALAVLGILHFTWIWNDFLWGLILTNADRMKPVMIGVLNVQGQYTTKWNLITAAALEVTIPTLVVFLLLQRYFIKGLTLGAVKG